MEDRGREAPDLTDILEDSAKCSAQELAIYSLPVCSYIVRGLRSLSVHDELKIILNAMNITGSIA